MPLVTGTDQLNRRIELPSFPQRIVSLVPSLTELLVDLGLEQQITGITKFCVRPEHLRAAKQIIGGTKNLDLAKITIGKPDLILASKEENAREQVEALAAQFPVWISDVTTLSSALEMIQSIGHITGKAERATELSSSINNQFMTLQRDIFPIKKVAYVIWNDPIMVAGNNTFINDMLRRCGFENVYTTKEARYPIIEHSELAQRKDVVILLSSEPYPFTAKHLSQWKTDFPDHTISLVNGEVFSWYGSRMMSAVPYMRQLRNNV